MRILLLALFVALVWLQYHLWTQSGGVTGMLRLKRDLARERAVNETLRARNGELLSEVRELQHDQEAVELHAREDFGMIRKGETFYQAGTS